jgi:hypothetical protein
MEIEEGGESLTSKTGLIYTIAYLYRISSLFLILSLFSIDTQ